MTDEPTDAFEPVVEEHPTDVVDLPPQPPAILALSVAAWPHAAALLARAQQDNPLMRWVLGAGPLDRHEWIWSRWLHMVAPDADARITRCGRAVALWLPPQAPRRLDLGREIRAGLLLAPLDLGPAVATRLYRALADLQQRRERHLVGQRTWVLDAFGVEPDALDQGLGERLLREGIDRADRENLPITVLTHHPLNLGWYALWGFRIVEQGEIGHSGVGVWVLRRRPGA